MRSTLILLLVVFGVGGMLLINARRSPAPAAAPATPSVVSQHNWAKKSLDRTADVKRQVADQQAKDGAP